MTRGVRLICGVGTNDADYVTQKSKKINGKWKNGWMCPYYRAWTRMLGRCYNESYLKTHPTYIGCSVCDEWLTFSNFKAWMETQDWEGKQLDKDIIKQGNKVYSPETVAFVSGAVNSFIIDCGTARGEWPIGVCWHKSRCKFRADCRNPFTKKREHLGSFICPNEAHLAWKTKKHELSCQLADIQTDPRVAEALGKRYMHL